MVINTNDTIILLVNMYGHNSKNENDTLFRVLESHFLYSLSKYPSAMIIMGGDFNIALNGLQDRWPPRPNPSLASTLIQFMHKFDLIDIWREKSPGMSLYTSNNKTNTSLSRIDFWLISNWFDKNVINVNIIPTPLTDHKAISIRILLNPHTYYRNSYWKLNSSILKHKTVSKTIQSLIDHYWQKSLLENMFCSNWELLKLN